MNQRINLVRKEKESEKLYKKKKTKASRVERRKEEIEIDGK